MPTWNIHFIKGGTTDVRLPPIPPLLGNFFDRFFLLRQIKAQMLREERLLTDNNQVFGQFVFSRLNSHIQHGVAEVIIRIYADSTVDINVNLLTSKYDALLARIPDVSVNKTEHYAISNRLHYRHSSLKILLYFLRAHEDFTFSMLTASEITRNVACFHILHQMMNEIINYQPPAKRITL